MAPNVSRMFYRVSKTPKGTISLEAGEAQGITKDARFSIHRTANADSEPIGELVVLKSNACSSNMRKTENSANLATVSWPAWALQTHAGEGWDLCVAVPAQDAFFDVFKRNIEEMEKKHVHRRQIRIVDAAKGESHEIAVVEADGKAVFDVTDQTCVSNNLRRLPQSVSLDADSVYPILVHAADFYWHLRRSNKDAPLQAAITIEAFELSSQHLDPKTFGEGSVWAPSGENMNVGDVIRVTVEDEPETRYGFNVKSSHTGPLYVWVFGFNMSDFSVGAFHYASSRESCLILCLRQISFTSRLSRKIPRKPIPPFSRMDSFLSGMVQVDRGLKYFLYRLNWMGTSPFSSSSSPANTSIFLT